MLSGNKLCGLQSQNFSVMSREYLKNNIFSDSPTSKIAPGIGHWDFARHNTRGLIDTNSIFPCKLAKFENYKMFIPNNPEKYLLNTYGDYMSFPEDVGVAHHWEEMDNIMY